MVGALRKKERLRRGERRDGRRGMMRDTSHGGRVGVVRGGSPSLSCSMIFREEGEAQEGGGARWMR